MSSPSGKDHPGVLEYGDNDFDYEHHVDVNDHDKHIYHGDNDHNDGVAPLH